jgi:VWFA-related protein
MAGRSVRQPFHPTRHGRVRALSAAACVAALASLSAQAGDAAQQPPTFRGGANYIRVDLYASVDGTPVTDLRQEEIQILEDGAPQQITAFEHVQVPTGGPESTRVEPNSVRAGEQAAADPRARVFVLFLDTRHMDVQVAQQLRAPVRRFMEEALGPDDLIAVMTPEMPVTALTFTRRTTILSGILGDSGEWLRRDADFDQDQIERLYEQCYDGATAREMIARRREKLSLDSLEALAVHLGALRDERKAVLVVTLGWDMFEENPRLAQQGSGAPPPLPIDRLGGGADPAGARMDSLRSQCEADRMALSRINHRDRMRDITGEANRGNVSFYPISSLRNQGTLAKISALRTMAEETDGVAVVNTNSFIEPMRRLISDTSSYYLLGYTSTNSKLDGRFRRISVRVARPHVEVRARRGYLAAVDAGGRTTPSGSATAARPDNPAAAAVRRMPGAVIPIPLRVRMAPWTRQTPAASTSTGTLWVVAEVDAQTRKSAAWARGGHGEVTVLSSDGRQVLSKAFDLPGGQAALAV